MIALGSAIGIASVRWCLEPELEADLEVHAIQKSWEEEDRALHPPGLVTQPTGSKVMLSIVVPASWIMAKRTSRRSVEFDRTFFWLAVFLAVAIIWNAVQQPYGIKRLLWWPIAEVCGLWG